MPQVICGVLTHVVDSLLQALDVRELLEHGVPPFITAGSDVLGDAFTHDTVLPLYY